MVLGRGGGGAQRGRERGLELTRTGRTQTLHLQAERLAEGQLALQRGGGVGVAGRQQGAAAAIPRVQPAVVGQLGRERRPPRGAREVEREQALLAEARLRAGRQHSGGHAGGAGADPRAFEHDRAQAAQRRPPGDGEADHSAADDGEVGGLLLR